MKQVIQNFKTGELKVDEVPIPALKEGGILVKNYYSVISSGTEKSTVSVGQSSMIGKARQKPEQVKQVIDTVKKEGLLNTYQKVQNKLSMPKALGYSSAGRVIAVAEDVTEFSIGDQVACSGQDYASHADVVFIPKNLATKITGPISMEEAAFTTMGSIALQGVRLCEVELGHKVAVIGLGLLGNIACQLLKASGANVLAIDLNEKALENLKNFGIQNTANIGKDDVEKIAENFSNGYGVDSVLITAGTSSNEPIELAGTICRKKGRVVVTGAVRMDIPRDNYFKKEIEVVISSSYGPGRYDPDYEEHGTDYPYAYVRFTENRNFQTILDLINQNKLDFKSLISHRYSIDEALKAYDLILGKTDEDFTGILLEYEQEIKSDKTNIISVSKSNKKELAVSFIGAGSYAQSFLLPAVKSSARSSFVTVCTGNGINAKKIAEKYSFNNCTTDSDEVTSDTDTDLVFIATRHNNHAKLCIKSLKAGKHVFVEKPLAMSKDELEELTETYNKIKGDKPTLMVGFNRRFSSLSVKLKTELAQRSEPVFLTYRINAGFIPKNHWIQSKEEGGGRIIGEVCHFIDYAKFVIGADVKSVFAKSIKSDNSAMTNEDTVSIVLSYKDGSVAVINYIANGDKSVSKERIEITTENKFFILDNFSSLSITKNGKSKIIKDNDKGQKACAKAFIDSVLDSSGPLIPFNDLYETTNITFDILKSVIDGRVIEY